MTTLLIVDDHQQITSTLKEYAEQEGYQVFLAEDGEAALQLFHEKSPDLLLLDVMMPKKNGFDVCREIRQSSNVPIIMITARTEDFERIMGLDIGADDYITKPFSPHEVMARVRAILRRIQRVEGKKQIFTCDNLAINLDDYIATIGTEALSLTKKELEIFWTLATHQGKVFSRDQLLDSLWGHDYYGDNRTVDSHIRRLRSKLDNYDHPQWEIKTIWGVGYKFEAKK